MLFVQKYVTIFMENYFKGIKKMNFLAFLTKYRSKITLYTILLIMVTLSVFNYTRKYHKSINQSLNADEISLCACVTSQPVYEDGKYKFTGDIISAEKDELLTLSANFYLEGKKGIKFYPNDLIRLTGELEFADSGTNDGSFDQKMYYMSENIHANVYSSSEFEIIRDKNSGIIKTVGKLRNSFMYSCDEYFSARYSGLIKALVSGETAFIEKADSDVLKKSGIYHIIAISGMHLNIFIIFASFIVNRMRLKGLVKALVLAFVSIMISLFVLLFTQFGLSIVRAFVMLVISLGGGIFRRRYRPKTALFLSTVIILFFIPQSFYNVGYQLSVLSTFAVLISVDIIGAMYKNNKIRSISQAAWFGSILISALCFVTNMPVMIKSFGFISVYAWFANLLVLPVATPCLVLGVLFAVVSVAGFDLLARIIAFPLKLSMQFMISSAETSVALPYSVVKIFPMYVPQLCMVTAFVCTLVYFLCKRRARLILPAALILTIGIGAIRNYRTLFPPDAKIVFADVGQGDCSFIRLPGGEAVMVDFGSNYMTEYLADEIEKTLVKNNIGHLDAVFITHPHTDHMAGITELAERKLAEKIYIPKYYDEDESSIKNLEELARAAKLSNTEIFKIEENNTISISDAVFTILHPNGDTNGDDNDMSAVIKFSYGEIDVLFTGDLSEKGCANILDKDIECEILKIPHHGAKNKLTSELVERTNADYAIISCGRNNIYRHPHKDTMAALEEKDIEILRTDTDGAVSIEFDKNKINSVKKAL